MKENYIVLTKGINNWKRYLISFFLLLLVIVIAAEAWWYAGIWYVEYDGIDTTFYVPNEEILFNFDSLIEYTFTIIPYVIMLIGMAITIKLVHKRSILSLITLENKVNWKRILWSLSLVFLLLAVTAFCDYLLFLDNYKLKGIIRISKYKELVFLVIIVAPLQALTEELFYRGFLLQWIGSKFRNIFLLSFIVGVIDALIYMATDAAFYDPNYIHIYNPFYTGLRYFLIGFIFTFITLKTNSLELSIGARMANLLYFDLLLLMNYFGLSNLFYFRSHYSKLSLLWLVITLAVFVFFSLRRYKQRSTVNSSIQPEGPAV